jgi:transposase
MVMEDNATPHTAVPQKQLYKVHEIKWMLLGANSPDLNAIEPTWNWMKRKTTKNRGFTGKKAIEEAWI